MAMKYNEAIEILESIKEYDLINGMTLREALKVLKAIDVVIKVKKL